MKLLLDMGLAQSTARLLRTQGHDAIHLREQGLQRLDDQLIVAKALHEDRIIVTHDLDFGRIVALSGDRSPASLPSGLRTCERTKSIVTFRTFSLALLMGSAPVHSSVSPNKR